MVLTGQTVELIIAISLVKTGMDLEVHSRESSTSGKCALLAAGSSTVLWFQTCSCAAVLSPSLYSEAVNFRSLCPGPCSYLASTSFDA